MRRAAYAATSACEMLEHRRMLAFSPTAKEPDVTFDDGQYGLDDRFVLQGNEWPQPGGNGTAVTITYGYSNALDGLFTGVSNTEIRNSIEEGLQLWTAVAPLHIEFSANQNGTNLGLGDVAYNVAPDAAQIFIGHHGFGGVGGVLAHGFFPPPNGDEIAGDIHFDDDDTWDTVDGVNIFDLIEVSTHEIGHTLGLDHQPAATDAIMNPIYGARFTGPGSGFLLADDIAGIQARYGGGFGYVLDESGNLFMSGTETGNTITLSVAGGIITGTTSASGGGTFTRSTAGVNAIIINSRGGSDTININANSTTIPITVNGWVGNDTVNIGNGDYDTNIGSTVFFNGGDGTDDIVINDTTDGFGSDTYTFGTNFFDKPTIGQQTTFSAIEQFRVNGSPEDDTIDIQGTISTVDLTWNAGAGNDTFNLGNANSAEGQNGTPTLNGEAGTDSLNYLDSANTLGDTYTMTSTTLTRTANGLTTFNTMENVSIDLSSGNTTTNIESASSVSTDLATLVLTAQGGDDTFNMASGDLENDLAFVAITVTGAAGADSMYLNDLTDPEFDGDTYTFTSTTFDKNTAGLNLITFLTMEDVTLDCNPLDNIVNVQSFSSVSTDLASLTIRGNGGDDAFNMASGDAESDLAFVSVVLAGNAGADSLYINDLTDAEGDADTYTITNNTFDKNTAGVNPPWQYSSFETFELDANPFATDITVASTAGSTAYTINGNNGNDAFFIGTGNLDSLPSNITIVGNAGTDSVEVNDSANAFNDTYTITSTTLDRAVFGLLTYGTVESLLLNAETGNNAINVQSTLAATPLTVNGNAGGDTMVVSSAAADWDATILGNVTFNGGTESDTIRIVDTADVGNDNYTVTSLQTTKTSIASTINYSAVEAYSLDANNDINTILITSAFSAPFLINGNGGADTINLQGNIATSFVTIDGGAGLDNITVNSDAAGVATAHFNTTQDLASLTILNGGTAVMEANGSRVIDTDSLTIAASGKLDLVDNDMIVDYGGATQMGVITALINLGRNGGAWNGFGITSSAAQANPLHNTTLGRMEGSEYDALYGAATLFDGRAVDATAIIVKYTYYGDADFNGQVNFDDYSRIDGGFNFGRTNWVNGDFDGNGVINFDDYSLIDLAFNTQTGVL